MSDFTFWGSKITADGDCSHEIKRTTNSAFHFSYAAKSLQSCPTLCDPIDGNPPGSLSLGFSRQEHWSGLPFPSPMHESEVVQSCPTLLDPVDCSPPGSSIHGIFQAPQFPSKVENSGIAQRCHLLFISLYGTWTEKLS